MIRPAPATASATFVVEVMFEGSVKVSILYWVVALAVAAEWEEGGEPGKTREGQGGPGNVPKVNCAVTAYIFSAASHLRVDMVVVDRVDHRMITGVYHNLVVVARCNRGHRRSEGAGAKHTDLHRRVTQVVTRQFRIHCQVGMDARRVCKETDNPEHDCRGVVDGARLRPHILC